MNSNSLESASNKRKERLTALKSLRFRSYEPETATLKQFIADAPDVGPVANQTSDTIENRSKEIQDAAKLVVNNEVDLADLMPKKENWDLKRRIQPKLDKLERKTLRVISDCIRERLKKEGEVVVI